MRTHFVDSFGDLPRPAHEALACAERTSLFLGRDWFDLLAAHLVGCTPRGERHPAAQHLCLAYAASGNDTESAVVVPLIETPRRQLLDLRRLDALANYYSSLYAPICDPSAPAAEAALREIAVALRRRNPAPDLLQLSPLDRDSPVFGLLQGAFRAAGWWVQTYFCFGNWHLPCAGLHWPDYLAQRPGELRSTLKRKQKKFAAIPGARIEILTGEHDEATAIAAYNSVYAHSWKVPEPYPEFIPGLIGLAARRGWLRMGIAWLDDKPVAAQLWLVAHGKAAIYKLAYDEAHATLSAGTLLTARLVEHVLETDKVREIDYLTGDDAYKQAWMTHRRELWGVAAFNPATPRGCFRGVADFGRSFLGRLVSQRTRRA